MSYLYFNHPFRQTLSVLQERAVKEAYHAIYAFAGAKSADHFIVTSSGAEGVNHAVFAAYLDITRKTGKNHFLCSSQDEAPAIMSMTRLNELGCVFQMIPVEDSGRISKKTVAEMLTPRTAMLSISWANALTGVVQPLAEISALCKDRGILLHVEGTHVLGKGDFSFEESGADLLTFGPPFNGIGGMFIREGIEISPMILGGNNQNHLRAGSINIPLLLEFARWAKEENEQKDHYCMEIARLRSLFEDSVCERIPQAQCLFRKQERLPQITSFLFPGAASEALFYLLYQKGLVATYGGGHLQHFSHILKACAISEPDCHCGISFGFSHSTTEEEIKKGAAIVVEAVRQLQHYSARLIKETV